MRFKQYLTEAKLRWKKVDNRPTSGKWEIWTEKGHAGTIGYQESLAGKGKRGKAMTANFNELHYDGKLVMKRRSPAISDLKKAAQRIQDLMDSEKIKDPIEALEMLRSRR